MAEDGIMCCPSGFKQKSILKRAFNSIVKLELILMSNLTQEYRSTLSGHCWLHDSLPLLFLYSFSSFSSLFLFSCPSLPFLSGHKSSLNKPVFILFQYNLHNENINPAQKRCVPLTTPITSTKAIISEYFLNNKP